MLPTIGRWRTHYRIAGEAGGGLSRLEHGVRERVLEAYAAGLEQLFGDDPAVYVLRHVQTELTVVNPSMANEPRIAHRWGERTCAAVVQTVTRHGDDASRVMRFDDPAAFIAQWIADLLDGVAWERWYYGAFARYRALAIDDAIRAVLLDNREHLAAILRRLGSMRRLPVLLSRISQETARELWRSAVRGEVHEISHEQFRVFVRAALEIADALALWSDARPDEQQLFEAYVAESMRTPDWKQARELARAVFAVLLFLERYELVRVGAVEVASVQEVIAAFEWLDAEWLAAAVVAWVRREPDVVAFARPVEMTALQRRIVEVLRELLASGAVVLSRDESARESDALAWFAALAKAEPALAEHAAAPALIEKLLADEIAKASAIVLPGPPDSQAGERLAIESAYAGILLLSRVIVEARVPRLAEVFGLDVPSVLLALAEAWGADRDDPGIVVWSGLEGESVPLDAKPWEALRVEIVRLMRDRAAFAPSLEPDEHASIASQLLRLWAHWLPGLARSTEDWLLGQLILRPGVLHAGGGTIAVALRPAALDVVLELARYLDPIDWVGGRRITFAIDRSLA